MGPMNYVEPPDIPEGMTIDDWRRKRHATHVRGRTNVHAARLAHHTKGFLMLLIVGIVLLVIAIAGGAIVHPVLFALGIVALVLFFQR